MKKLVAAIVLASAVVAVPALADGGVSIRVGEPVFFGQLNLGRLLPRLLDPAGLFIRDDRYRNEYAAGYREQYARDRRHDRRDDRYDRRDDRRDGHRR